MKSRAVGRFWRLYDKLPAEIRRIADKQFAFWLKTAKEDGAPIPEPKGRLVVA
jgi:hypothetical protein